MTTRMRWFVGGVVIALLGLSGCAGLPESGLARPDVSLRSVQVLGLGFNEQTFLLTFDVHNSNPFPLPVNEIYYDVRLDGHRFASGQALSDLSIPATGTSEFAMSVELDLLQTAPQLVSIVRDGVREEIPYEIEGRFGLDLPLAPALSYQGNGAIRVQPDSW